MQFKNLPNQDPFKKFEDYYLQAEANGQPIAEAGCISSVDADGRLMLDTLISSIFLKII